MADDEDMNYNVIIVGAGPAGIFCALELISHTQTLKVLIIEQGKDIDRRSCPMNAGEKVCMSCPECELISGWGGAGAYSDGKLTLSREIGGFLSRYMETDALQSLIDYVD